MFNFQRPKDGIIGHRGAKAIKPENTLLSFKTAFEEGADCIEFDVKLTKDGKMVIFHDDDLDRTTNGKGSLSTMTLDQLKALDAGLGETIPTFEETVQLAKECNLKMNIEIKDDGDNGLKIAKLIAEYINYHWPNNLPLPLVSSFIHKNLIEFRKYCPDIAIGFLIDEPTPEIIELVKNTQNASLNFEDPKTPIETINPLIQQPFNVLIYTVNDKLRVKTLIDAGVFAVFTDDPGKMLRP